MRGEEKSETEAARKVPVNTNRVKCRLLYGLWWKLGGSEELRTSFNGKISVKTWLNVGKLSEGATIF